MLVLCINKGNPGQYKPPEIGIVYKVIRKKESKIKPGDWYVIDGSGLMHHSSLFEELSNDFISCLTMNKKEKEILIMN